jgi:hypothetical protein
LFCIVKSIWAFSPDNVEKKKSWKKDVINYLMNYSENENWKINR